MQQIFTHKFFDVTGGVLRFLASTNESWTSFVQRQAADLHSAIDKKDSQQVQTLIAQGGADISMIDESVDGSTVRPLHRGAFAGDVQVMRVLLAEVLDWHSQQASLSRWSDLVAWADSSGQ